MKVFSVSVLWRVLVKNVWLQFSFLLLWTPFSLSMWHLFSVPVILSILSLYFLILSHPKWVHLTPPPSHSLNASCLLCQTVNEQNLKAEHFRSISNILSIKKYFWGVAEILGYSLKMKDFDVYTHIWSDRSRGGKQQYWQYVMMLFVSSRPRYWPTYHPSPHTDLHSHNAPLWFHIPPGDFCLFSFAFREKKKASHWRVTTDPTASVFTPGHT